MFELLPFYTFGPLAQNTVHFRSGSSILMQMAVQLDLKSENYFWHNSMVYLPLLLITLNYKVQWHFLTSEFLLRSVFSASIGSSELKQKLQFRLSIFSIFQQHVSHFLPYLDIIPKNEFRVLQTLTDLLRIISFSRPRMGPQFFLGYVNCRSFP